jgi:phosphonopyruvate decarboxylase
VTAVAEPRARAGRGEEQDDVGAALVRAYVEAGRTWFTGVPCSLLARTFAVLDAPERAGLDGRLTYVPAPREDSAVGVASGLAVAGSAPVVLMQNSGLGYCLNVLTSFTLIYDVHLPLVVSWRGHDDKDAVEHDVIGRELTGLLDLFGIARTELDLADPAGSVRRSLDLMDGGRRTSALLVKAGA